MIDITIKEARKKLATWRNLLIERGHPTAEATLHISPDAVTVHIGTTSYRQEIFWLWRAPTHEHWHKPPTGLPEIEAWIAALPDNGIDMINATLGIEA